MSYLMPHAGVVGSKKKKIFYCFSLRYPAPVFKLSSWAWALKLQVRAGVYAFGISSKTLWNIDNGHFD